MKRNAAISDSPYGRLPSALAVEVGDIVQCDLGMRIVTEVSKHNATAIQIVGPDRPKEIGLEVSKSRIIERRGTAGLAAFLLHKSARQEEERRLAQFNPEPEEDMKGKIKLQLGDQLCHGGEQRTVVQVTDRRALLENAAGKQVWEQRTVSEFLFTNCVTDKITRLNEQERAAHLEKFLASRTSPTETESTQPSDAQEDNMKARVKAGKVTKPKKPAKATNGKSKNEQAAPVNPEEGRSKGKLGQLFGHSVVRCVAAAGAKGATFEQVMAGLTKKGIKASESTVKHNLRLGKNGKLVGAALTKEELSLFGV